MANDENKLIVRFEAQIRSFEKALVKLQTDTTRSTGTVVSSFRHAEMRISAFDRAATATLARTSGAFSRLAAVAGGALSLGALTTAANGFNRVMGSLRVAGLEGEKLTGTFSRLFAIAQQNGAPIEDLAVLYGRLAQAQGELKATDADMMKFTGGVATALRVAGTSAQEASGALLQLSQAMGSGTVHAEEYNSINEGLRPVLQAVAAGMSEAGGSVAKLTALVKDGKVSSAGFFAAFLAGLPVIESKVAGAAQTTESGITKMSNAFKIAAGAIDEATGATRNFNDTATTLSGYLEKTPEYLRAASSAWQRYKDSVNAAAGAVNRAMGYDSDEATRAAGLVPIAEARAEAAKKAMDEAARARNAAVTMGGFGGDTGSADKRIATAFDVFAKPDASTTVKPISIKDYPAIGKAKGGGGSDTDEFERAQDQMRKRIALIEAESSAIGKSRFEQEKAVQAARLLEAAKAADLTITPAVSKSIDELSSSYANAVVKAEEMEKAHDKLVHAADRVREGLADVTTGFVSDLRQGITAAEAFGNAMNRVLDRIIDKLVNSAIASLLGDFGTTLGGAAGGGGIGGLLASIFHDGSPSVGSHAAPMRAMPASAFRYAPRFHSGLLPGEMSAILKRGEAVLNDNLTQRVSGTMAGLAEKAGGNFGINIGPTTIHAPGADSAAVARLEAAIAARDKALPGQIIRAVNEGRSRGQVR